MSWQLLPVRVLVALALLFTGCSDWSKPPNHCDGDAEALGRAAGASQVMNAARGALASENLEDVEVSCLDDNSGDASTWASFDFADARDFDAVAADLMGTLRSSHLAGLTIKPEQKDSDPNANFQFLGTWRLRGNEFWITLEDYRGAYTFYLRHPLE